MSPVTSALAEVWSWTLPEVLSALRYPAEHHLSADELDRMVALRGIDFAAGILVERAVQEQGWQPAAQALLAAAFEILSAVEAPPMALAFLSSARTHLQAEGVTWEAIELYTRAAHDPEQPPRIGGAAKVALTATQLAGEPAPADLTREAIGALFGALPEPERITLLCRLLASLEKALAGRDVAPSALRAMALQGWGVSAQRDAQGASSALDEVHAWGPAEVLRALRLEVAAGIVLGAEELDRWAALDGVDFAFGLVVARADQASGTEEAAALLREAHSFVFRELGVALREQEPISAVRVLHGVEHEGRALARKVAQLEGGPALLIPLLARLESRAEALSGNGSAGSPITR